MEGTGVEGTCACWAFMNKKQWTAGHQGGEGEGVLTTF